MMSEIRLVIRDASLDIHGTSDYEFADSVLAALSAEPETIDELDAAIERFRKPTELSFFETFIDGVSDDPHDGGRIIIDLAARLFACESSDWEPLHEGCVSYHDGHATTKHNLRFHLPKDWEITSQLAGWRSLASERRRERNANPPFDVRAVLYGRPLLEFIAAGCFEIPLPVPVPAAAASGEQSADDSANEADGADANWPQRDEGEYAIVRNIHIHWMMTPRDDLRGQSPREVLLAKRDFLGWDMQDREERWSRLGEPARGLDPDSYAYRFAGFGTHEIVTYYEMVRHLLWTCRDRQLGSAPPGGQSTTSKFLTVGDFLASEVPALEAAREAWLDTPDPEISGRTPRSVIDHERARLPEGGSGHEAMIDDDCPLCQMMADMPGPMFWHLDGSSMDDDFAFEMYCRTREEWEEEQRRHEEFRRKFNEEWAEKKRLGVESSPGGGYASPDSIWERSFVNSSAPDFPAMRIFAIGSNLAELIVDLKQPTENRPLIDQLSRDFGNLREVSASPEAEAIVGPVLDRFCETLDSVAAARADLQEKCADLQERLRRFSEPPSEEDPESGSFSDDYPYPDDDDVPF